MKVELINTPTVITDETLKQYLADCSSVVRNAQPKDNNRLFNRLVKESYGYKASRVFEYIPCKIKHYEIFNPSYMEQYFGFFDDNYYYTNTRELLNWGMEWEDVIEVVDFTNYKAVKVTAPYFLYGQASTHTQITSVSHSNRYSYAGLGYWKPSEVSMNQELWNKMVKDDFAPSMLEKIMKEAGITRREVYARGSDMLEYRAYTLGGYTNNPNAWEHFINQRLHDPHTQKEMRDLAELISKAIYNE